MYIQSEKMSGIQELSFDEMSLVAGGGKKGDDDLVDKLQDKVKDAKKVAKKKAKKLSKAGIILYGVLEAVDLGLSLYDSLMGDSPVDAAQPGGAAGALHKDIE
jgi:hypothetical protein